MRMPTLILSALLLACGSISVAKAADNNASDVREGRELYLKKCGLCHQERGFGANILAQRLGAEKSLLENRRDLDPLYIRVVVRRGLAGMPPFTKVELTDYELNTVASYLTRQDR